MLVKVEELTADLSRVRLFHTSVSRAIATWPTWPGEPGFTGDFAEYLAQKFPTSTAADFAILEAGVTSEETYVEQGLYWATGHLPMLEYVAETYQPDLLLVGMPTTDEFQHQFLGLVSPDAARRRAEPGLRRRRPRTASRTAASRQREAFIRTAYQEADETLTLRPQADGQGPDDVRRVRPRLRAAVPGDRRQPAARRPRPAVAAADVELPSRRRARRSARPRPAGPAARSRSTSTSPAAIRPAAASRRSPRPTSRRPSRRSRRSTSASPTRTTGPTTASPRAGR